MISTTPCKIVYLQAPRCDLSTETWRYCAFRKGNICRYEIVMNMSVGDLVMLPFYKELVFGVIIKTTQMKARVQYRSGVLKEVKEGWRKKYQLLLIKKRGEWNPSEIPYPLPFLELIDYHLIK